jgi:hypothetical protein
MDKIDGFDKPLSIDLSMNEFIDSEIDLLCMFFDEMHQRDQLTHIYAIRLAFNGLTSLKDEARRPVCLLASAQDSAVPGHHWKPSPHCIIAIHRASLIQGPSLEACDVRSSVLSLL